MIERISKTYSRVTREIMGKNRLSRLLKLGQAVVRASVEPQLVAAVEHLPWPDEPDDDEAFNNITETCAQVMEKHGLDPDGMDQALYLCRDDLHDLLV